MERHTTLEAFVLAAALVAVVLVLVETLRSD
jgi:hypothetical protein